MTTANPNFDVRAFPERGEWRISVTSNGYQWQTLSVTIAAQAKAERIAAYLKTELAPEDAREYARVVR